MTIFSVLRDVFENNSQTELFILGLGKHNTAYNNITTPNQFPRKPDLLFSHPLPGLG